MVCKDHLPQGCCCKEGCKAVALLEVSVDAACTTQPSTASRILSKNSVRKVLGFGVTVLHSEEAVTGLKRVISIVCFFPLTIL